MFKLNISPTGTIRRANMPEQAKSYTGKKTRAKLIKRECHELNRGTAAQRGYNGRWQRARLLYLQEYPLCQVCEANGHVEEATTVDHIIPHRGNQTLFWDVENWQSLCKACHDRKTGKGQ